MKFSVTSCPRSWSPYERLVFEGKGTPLAADLGRNGVALERVAQLAKGTFDRVAIADLLRGENPSPTPAQTRQLDRAEAAGSCFILTGQQPGLLGGPVYWLYKALTAIRLAEKFGKELGHPVIPLFWIAGDDSDLAEVNHLELLDVPSGRGVRQLNFRDAKALIPVAERIFGGDARELCSDLGMAWKESTMIGVKELLAPGLSFAASFSRLAQRLLGDTGLLFVNGNSPVFCRLARPMMERVVAESGRLADCLARSDADLKAGGLVPVVQSRPEAVHAFVLEGGVRRRILREGDQFFLALPGGGRRELPPDFFHRPEISLTHDVLSRPLLAGAVFPLLGHVLGPSETGYFCQLRHAFDVFLGSAPPVHPRLSATCLSTGAAEAFGAAGFGLEELPGLKSSVLQARLGEAGREEAGLGDDGPDELFQMTNLARNRHQVIFDGAEGKGLIRRLEARLEHAWEEYCEGVAELKMRQSPEWQALKPHWRWLGEGLGQERHLNVFSLLDQTGGEEGLQELLAALDPLERGHQVVVI